MSEDNTIDLKPLSISEITDKNFFIRHYQRGYRWTKQQVEQLLNDIDEFQPSSVADDRNKETFYCLQPIVVKQINADTDIEKELEGDWHEVIDGQQRLTTIYLILHYINERWVGPDKEAIFKVDYETRGNCVDFLNQLKVNEDSKTVCINKDYIDFYHISTAYQVIRNWELSYKERNEKIFNKDDFKRKFLHYSKVIWYEVNQGDDSNDLFERLNLGKIPLTNAELTKALFLADSSFSKLGGEKRNVKRFEIAHLWDEIEHKLNEADKKFWSFITNHQRDKFDTKIELILDLIADKSEDEKDPLFTFLQFSQKHTQRSLADIWSEIEQFYYTLVEWNNDKDLYHQIGYLISSRGVKGFEKKKLSELVKFSLTHDKCEFKQLIQEQIEASVNFEISELDYEDKNHSNKIFNVLLLFNVETYRQSNSIAEFYPFKQHKGNQWSLEHIHARNSKGLDQNKKEQWYQWLDHHGPLLDELKSHKSFKSKSDEIIQILSDLNQYNNQQLIWERFSELFKRINDILTDNPKSMDSDSNSLSNLALLSQPDNAALNCSAFEVKRREIVRMDKVGHFIPVCTRRVFLKYYQKDSTAGQSFFWSSGDRTAYIEELTTMLQDYLPVSGEESPIED